MFKFREPVRPFITSLVRLMYFANREGNIPWASQSYIREDNGVYGFASDTFRSILRAEVLAVADEVYNRFELGADDPTVAAVERVVQDVLNDREADRRYQEEERLAAAMSLTDADLELPEVEDHWADAKARIL